jgi:hypothetical protein
MAAAAVARTATTAVGWVRPWEEMVGWVGAARAGAAAAAAVLGPLPLTIPLPLSVAHTEAFTEAHTVVV